MGKDEIAVMIHPNMLKITEKHIVLQSPVKLKTLSSGVVGPGFGSHHIFVNRHVDKNYQCTNHREDMERYLEENGFQPKESVGMMTAVKLEDVAYTWLEEQDMSLLIVVTAGTGNAVDAANSENHSSEFQPGTINTWIFVNGTLSEEAFVQSIVTATEAKVRALESLEVKDPITGTSATGTSTDSILVGATQQGTNLEYAGTITPLGKLISKGVYTCTREAVEKSLKRKMH
ncbi:adenosylcobinamide amidohydrolase [Compostibacillus humi]|nr:adenosylcobinamide amidohydrolase [Compostibacillus humi]